MAAADEPTAQAPAPETAEAGAPLQAIAQAVSGQQPASAEKPKYPPFAELLKDAETTNGLIKLHKKGSKLYGELPGSVLNKDLIVVIAIAKGIAERPILAGMTWGFGDDWIWQFKKVDDDIQIVRRNVRFRAASGSPEERAVKLAYTDSVLFSLPIATMSPSGNAVVDLSPVFMSDLPQISQVLPGFSLATNKSTWASLKGFENNVNIQVAATYVSGGTATLDTVPDSRGATINVHYSISVLPQTGYTPRMADDRIGYFLTVVKDFTKAEEEDRFVRYINRWQLQKSDSSSAVSPPKEPIIFWLEKTIPYPYRQPIREGIEEWNKAFSKIGFANAIEVRQQADDADWDPEDIRYNTFRWITASAGFAMGPSRVNPLTGQILDADIIFDADFVSFWKQEYETFTAESVAALTGGPLDVASYLEEQRRIPAHLRHGHACRCDFHQGLVRELAFGSAALAAGAAAEGKPMQEKLIMQGLKEITMHELGHTLGLRHNFKASSWRTLEELNDPAKTAETGQVASVMDYSPPNIVPKGTTQGDYYPTTIGPYDYWAIEYGYKPLSGGTDGEVKELKAIAARCGQPEYAYATDEDTRGIDPDPLVNRFDLGSDPVAYAKQRVAVVTPLWPGLVNQVTKEGDGYQRARQAFGVLLGNEGRALFMAARNVGGIYVSRDHRGDANARMPFVIVPVEKQREALALLEEHVFSDKPFQFPPELYNYLAASRWSHWGEPDTLRLDYPAHEVILLWQDRILSQLMSTLTLERIHDSELKVPADQEAFTTAELLDRLTKAVYAEVDAIPATGEFTNRKPAISSYRRNLQRSYFKRLANLAMGNVPAPQDCQTVAFAQLTDLNERISKLLASNAPLDPYSKAHLRETSARIQKVVDSRLELRGP